MITATHAVGERDILFRIPPTSRDVLDWTVWIAARDTDPAASALRALQWASQWVLGVDDLDALLAEHAPENPFLSLVGLCDAIASSAGLPQDVLDNLATLLARKTATQEKWLLHEYERFRPDGACRCTKCVAASRGVEMANGKNERCVFDGIDPRALCASRVMDVADPSEPYYMAQVRAVVDTESYRRDAYRRKREEARKSMPRRGAR